MHQEEKNKIINAIIYPFLFVGGLFVVHMIQYAYQVNWFHYGIYPLSIDHLSGIVFSVFIHSDIAHLFNNAVPLLILGSMLFYFYKK